MPENEDDVCWASERRWIAASLASTEAWSDFSVAARVSRVVCRASASAMVALGLGVVGLGGSGGEGEWRGGDGWREEEPLDRDTRLSRASRDRVAGPRLRRL